MRRGRLIAIGDAYGVKISRIRPYSSYYKANAAYRVYTDQGDRLIKPFQVWSAGPRLPALFHMNRAVSHMKKLIRSGYPHMPQWRRTKTGKYWVMDQGRLYYMTDWVEGGSLSNDPLQFEALGRALAQLHSVPSREKGGKACSLCQVRRFRAASGAFQRHMKQMRGRKSAAARWFSIHGDQAAELSSKAETLIARPDVGRLLRTERRDNRIVHGDVTRPNIIVASDGIKLIDWDSVKTDSVYYEIAKTLSNTTGFETELMEPFLRGYLSFKPLRPEEKQLAAAFFLFPREVWSAAKYGAAGKPNDVFKHVEMSWDVRLKAAEWMLKWAETEESG